MTFPASFVEEGWIGGPAFFLCEVIILIFCQKAYFIPFEFLYLCSASKK